MDEQGGDTESSMLLTHDKEQRIGLLRIFHHKLYCKEKNGNKHRPCYRALYYHYCQRNKSVSWGLSIGVCFLITGVLCVTYGFMVPGIYRTLGTEQNASHFLQSNTANNQRSKLPTVKRRPENSDRQNMTLYRNVFVITGLAIFAIGGILLSVFLLWPAYDNEDLERSPLHSPIFVEYELPEVASDDSTFHSSKMTEDQYEKSESVSLKPKNIREQPNGDVLEKLAMSSN